MTRLAPLVLACLLALQPARPVAEPPVGVTGKVTAVHDGDTISTSVGGKVLNIRMIGIDACELSQGPPGLVARDWLALSLPIGTQVALTPDSHHPRDLYGRTLAWVSVVGDPEPVNVQAVREGMAFAFRPAHGAVDHWGDLIGAEAEARAEHKGVWAAGPDGVERPWLWRKRKHPR